MNRRDLAERMRLEKAEKLNMGVVWLEGGPETEEGAIAMEGTEPEWNVADSKLPVIFEGCSAAGKDNVKTIILGWIWRLAEHDPDAVLPLLAPLEGRRAGPSRTSPVK